MKIVVDDKIPFLKGALEPMAEIVYVPGKEIRNETIRDADALLIRTRTKCTPELLEGTNVKFIGTATIGYDHIDINYCRKNGIAWTNAPGCNSSSVRQYITSALLRISIDQHFDLKDKTIGIIGVGNVGSKVEKVAHFLGMNVMLNDPPRARVEGNQKFVQPEDILNNADIITVHVPLNITGDDKTWHLFNEKSFKKMKKGTWFINSSRGEVVDGGALKKTLESDKIKAVLDVWENEPDIDKEILNLAYIATPHIAGYSTDGKANGTAMVVNSVCSFFGLPLKDWYPVNVPAPAWPEISIDGNGKSDTEILLEAVSHTYNIMEDDGKLRLDPGSFEKQRGDYRLRREFSSYSVRLKSVNEGARKKLEELGFKLI